MKKALEPLVLSWHVPELRNRLLYVLGMMIIYVFTLWIPIPNVDHNKMNDLMGKSGGLLDVMNVFGGGALKRLSIAALGIMPYITASIVFQVLTMAFPYFKDLQQEGEYGRRKLGQWTRWSAIGLTLVQAAIATKAFMTTGVMAAGTNPAMFFMQTVLILTAGSMYLLWMGERITEKGVGNGISFIIFAGIVAAFPQVMRQLVATASVFQFVALGILFVGTVVAIVFVTEGERRIPVKYAPRQAGRRMVQTQRSYIPLRMAAANVMPIIFAISIVLFPGQIAQFYIQSLSPSVIAAQGIGFKIAQTITQLFAPQSWFASIIYGLLVLAFTYFYTAVIFDVRELSDNLKRYGGQVPGYAPGRPTYLFINRVLTRITFVGGVFLAAIALLQWWAPALIKLDQSGSVGVSTLVGGTSLLIVVAVAMEIMNNLDQQLKMRQYEGFSKETPKGRM
ncbi:MAG: preprotein translocase subunit SecY [Abditibacteriaceae bacterium]